MRFRVCIALALLAASLPCAAFANPFSPALSIDSVDPGYITSGKNSILLLSGHHLNRYQGNLTCDFAPVSGAAPSSVSTCSVNYIKGSKQLEVTLKNVPSTTDQADYLLRLCTHGDTTKGCVAPDTPRVPTATVQAATVVRVMPASNTPANGPTPPAKSPTPGTTTPYSDCINANATANIQLTSRGSADSTNVNCASSLLTESEVIDNFGRHVDKTYFAIQVRVSNQNSNYDFLLRDILLSLPDGRVVSSRIRRFAQGVAVKGKTLDRRAVVYNTMQATSSLYGGLAIFASAGFSAAGNALQGPLLAGFSQIFPDTTTDNVNRFNTAVFDDQNPSIVPKDSIGQPPLYVVALVPKSGNAIADKRFGERIAVSLEGTFIKQVSLVSITPSTIQFGSQFINTPGPMKTDTLITSIVGAQDPQKITISNNNSTTMNVSSIDVVSTSGAAGSSPDFTIDVNKSTCGDHSNPKIPWDPKSKFTIAPQSFCDLWVRLTPQGPGATSANVVVQGDNLDGSKTVYLQGQGVGFMFDFAQTTDGTKPILSLPDLKCSYADAGLVPTTTTGCSINLPDIGAGTTQLNIPFYFYTAAKSQTETLTVTQDTSNTVVSTCTSQPAPSTRTAGGNCSTKLDLTGKGGVTILNVSSTNNWTSKIRITYSTIKTQINVTAPAAVITGQNANYTVALEAASGYPAIPVGTANAQLAYTLSGGTLAAPVTGIVPLTNEQAVVSLKAPPSGTYTLIVSFPGKGIYDPVDSSKISVTVSLPMPTITSSQDLTAIAAANDFPFTLAVSSGITGVTCVGTVTPKQSQPSGLTFKGGTSGMINGGTTSFTVAAGSTPASYQVEFDYPGDGNNCAATSKTLTLTTK
jgi:hypothetical protein